MAGTGDQLVIEVGIGEQPDPEQLAALPDGRGPGPGRRRVI
jgi:hypothetical protein